MKITFYVNTMVLLESGKTHVLCDPWVTTGDESVSGYYNFPRSTLRWEEVAALKPDFIYISHTHPDHFDPPTLSVFDRATPILVSYYKQNFTERAIKRVGFTDVRVSVPGRWLPLHGDDRCWIEPSAHYPDLDSIAVFRLGDQTAVNANDNAFHRDQCVRLRERAGGIDIGLLPSGAHGPWPMFFENLSEEEKARHAEERAMAQKKSFQDYIEALRPRYVVPFAAGLVAGGDKALQYRYSGIRPRSEVVAYARQSLDFEPVLLSERCHVDFETGQRQGEYVEATYESEQEYLVSLAAKPNLFSHQGVFYVAPSERIDLTRLLALARQTQHKWQERKGIVSDAVYYFDVGDDALYRLTLSDDRVTRVQESQIQDEQYDLFRLPYELLLGILTRHYHWSNVNTQHVRFSRKRPGNRMDADLMRMINYLQV